MTHVSELDNTLMLTNSGILQKKETFYSVAAICVVNIGNLDNLYLACPEQAMGDIIGEGARHSWL